MLGRRRGAFFHDERSWPDQRHVAQQNVKELRKLVELAPTQKATDGRRAGVRFNFLERCRRKGPKLFDAIVHRAKLQYPEELTEIAHTQLPKITDNAQSVYELSQIEGIKEDIKKNFGFDADFENAKYLLEKGDGAGNTFKATAKPVLIGTAVVGATTMVFGIIMLLENMFGGAVMKLSIVQPEIILGLIMGGSVIYWFTGASCQAVVTGAYRAVVYIKEHMKLDASTASEKDSKEVVRICTVYAQKGMWNIFIVVFCFALALPFFNPYFFIGYLIGIAFFGLFQAIFMANAGGAWDNAKKIVEVDLRQKGTDLHAATVVGDTVGDPFKDTSSVAMNPVIKFTTLFGLLAVEIAVTMKNQDIKTAIGAVFFVIALIFVYRSFYGMRIPEESK